MRGFIGSGTHLDVTARRPKWVRAMEPLESRWLLTQTLHAVFSAPPAVVPGELQTVSAPAAVANHGAQTARPFSALPRPGSGDFPFGVAISLLNSVWAIAVQNDGKILLAGTYNGNLAVARYTASGIADSSFGTGGRATVDFGGSEGVNAMAIQPDGRIVIGGTSYAAGNAAVLARLSNNGTLDTTFGGSAHGKVYLTTFAIVTGMTIQRDGKIVCATGTGVARFNADGSADTTFGRSGYVELNQQTTNVAAQPDGRIVVAGVDSAHLLARLNSNGSLDGTFGTAGKLSIAGYQSTCPLALQQNGEILVGGRTGATNSSFLVRRLKANGTVDTSFGASGVASATYGATDVVDAIAVQSNGRIVAIGHGGSKSGGSDLLMLMRFLPTGALDPQFGTSTNGMTVAHTTVGPTQGPAYVTALQNDGKILVAGSGALVLARFVGDAAGSTPFLGAPQSVSQNIQAEDFDNLAYSDTTVDNLGGKYRYTPVDIQAASDYGGGYDVCYTKAGESIQYTVSVATAKSYSFQTRVTAPSTGGKFHLLVDGVSLGSVTVPNTGGWQSWQTVASGSRTLSAGTHTIRLVMDANGASGYVGNFNWIKAV